MYELGEVGDGVFEVRFVEAENGAPAGVVFDGAGGDIPVPEAVARGVHGIFKALGEVGEGLFGQFARGDVPADAQYADQGPIGAPVGGLEGVKQQESAVRGGNSHLVVGWLGIRKE